MLHVTKLTQEDRMPVLCSLRHMNYLLQCNQMYYNYYLSVHVWKACMLCIFYVQSVFMFITKHKGVQLAVSFVFSLPLFSISLCFISISIQWSLGTIYPRVMKMECEAKYHLVSRLWVCRVIPPFPPHPSGWSAELQEGIHLCYGFTIKLSWMAW